MSAFRPVQLVLSSEVEDTLVVGRKGDGGVGADEADLGVAAGVVVIAAVGRVDDYAAEHGVLDVICVGSPLNNIRCAGDESAHAPCAMTQSRANNRNSFLCMLFFLLLNNIVYYLFSV